MGHEGGPKRGKAREREGREEGERKTRHHPILPHAPLPELPMPTEGQQSCSITASPLLSSRKAGFQ